MLNFPNLDLFAVGLSISASLILGFIVYYKDRKNATNSLFLAFTLVCSAWNVLNYISYQVYSPVYALWIIRFVMFFAVSQAFFFYLLMCVFPGGKLNFTKKRLFILFTLIILVSILTLTPAVFSKVTVFEGSAPKPVPAPGIIIFAITAVSSVVAGIVQLIKKTVKAPTEEKPQFQLLGLGVVLMFILIIIFNFVFVAVFQNSSFIPLSAIFVLPFIGFTSYAIIKHKLLDIKIIGTEVITLLLIITTLVEVVLSSTLGEIVFRSGIFLALLIVGILLIKSVMREVEQREQLAELTDKLKALDKQKDEFISMAAHELRSPLTAIKGYVSMIMEGDTGDIPEKTRGFLADVNSINERLIRLVNNMLNVSRIEEGRMVYQLEVENMSRIARSVYGLFVPEAQRKGLKFDMSILPKIKDKAYVDVDKVHEIMANFLSNAIKYTDKGSVTIALTNPNPQLIRFEVVDTGPGISKEEQGKLFQKFYRVESNVGKTTGTGLGLYICRLLVEKFNGKIGVDSENGKGSTFWFEIPIYEESEVSK